MGQQSTGGMGQFGAFPGIGSNTTGTGGGLVSQNTGMANPFRQSTMSPGGVGNLPFGQGMNAGAFGASSPFAGQNQNQNQNRNQQTGQGQGQGFGQNFGGQGGSLI
jgi:hypothetical protein